jgi:hypothetical protein
MRSCVSVDGPVSLLRVRRLPTTPDRDPGRRLSIGVLAATVQLSDASTSTQCLVVVARASY